jgi:hypothetical protein
MGLRQFTLIISDFIQDCKSLKSIDLLNLKQQNIRNIALDFYDSLTKIKCY